MRSYGTSLSGLPDMPTMQTTSSPSLQGLGPQSEEPSDDQLSEAIHRHLGTQSQRGLMSNDALLSLLSHEFPINQGNLARYSTRVSQLRGAENSQTPQFSMITGKFAGEPL